MATSVERRAYLTERQRVWRAAHREEERAANRAYKAAHSPSREPRPVLCEGCGQPFTVGIGERMRRFCSKACQKHFSNRRYQAKLRATKPSKPRTVGLCERCGKPFEIPPNAPHKRFCSNACKASNTLKAHRARQMAKKIAELGLPEMTTCASCGKEFKTAFNRGKRVRTCSAACYQALHHAELKAAREARYAAMPDKICPFCGQKFRPNIRKPTQIYCSKACNDRAHRYPNLEAYVAYQAEKKLAEMRRCEKDPVRGLTTAQKNAVIRAQESGDRDALWAASKHWTPAQRTFAKQRYQEAYPSPFYGFFN